MIELRQDRLVFRFPEVHPKAQLSVGFQRTLRIPDDGRTYPLPAGLGFFPLRHVDDFARRVPESWVEHGGVMLPMYQSEAMWIFFNSTFPMAVKVAAGKINAVTGEAWDDGLHRGPQDYVVVPNQPWLDGYCVEKGVIRQFVAMPLGSGYSAEEQITGKDEHGGLQIRACPMRADVYKEWQKRWQVQRAMVEREACSTLGLSKGMGLAPGGRMRQQIYDDPHALSDWDTRNTSRCFVHLANSALWLDVTGEAPPAKPLTSKQYESHGIPWFDYYDDEASAVAGSDLLAKLKSWAQMGQEKRDPRVEDNDSITPQHIVELRKHLSKEQVREGSF